MMHTDAAEPRVHQITPAATDQGSSLLHRTDYEDAFVVDVGWAGSRDAEQWMRVILEDAPLAIRLRLISSWSAIGLKVTLSASERTVLGWEIRERDADFVLVGADSRLGMPGELWLRREEHALLFGTRVRHDNPIARALWASIQSAHVRTVRTLLESAGRRVTG